MQTLRPPIHHSIEVPLWRAPYTHDALSALLDSAELTSTASWSWRRPFKIRFTVTGPMVLIDRDQPLGC
jgi:hypothetical protein